jgi:hypothetical protein
MPQRPTKQPAYGHETGQIAGLDEWGFGGYPEGEWQGTATENPFTVPGPIGGGETYGLGLDESVSLDPLTGASGATYWPTDDPLGAEAYGDIQQAYGDPTFDPMDTANRDWRLDYNVGDTGYSLAAPNPYQGFPWVEGGYQGDFDPDPLPDPNSFVPQTFVDPNAGVTTPAQDVTRAQQITDPGQYETRVPNTEQLIDTGVVPGEADVMETATYPGGLQQLGTDPLTRLQAANLGTMMTTGGLAPTPMAAETESALRGSLADRGTGAEFETLFGQGVQNELQQLIDAGGALPVDRQRRAMELEGVRSYLDDLRESQLEQGMAAMADRGLVGQGPEYGFRERVEEGLAPAYAQAGQQLELAQRQADDQRYAEALASAQIMAQEQRRRGQEEYLTSLQQATGMTLGESQQLLNTIQTTGDLQEQMTTFGLDLLKENNAWNQFLANFGMTRDTVEEMVERNRLADVANLLNTYIDLAQVSQRGFFEAPAPKEGTNTTVPSEKSPEQLACENTGGTWRNGKCRYD